MTWLAESECGKEIRDRISNHKPAHSADAIYVSATYDRAAREWLGKWVDHLTGLADDRVIQLGAQRA